MLLRLFLTLVLLSTPFLERTLAEETFPERPLKIVVYTESGGVIDQTARQLALVLEKSNVAVPVVVENIKGGGGLVAIEHILRQPADGYTLFALTSSVISKAVASKRESRLELLDYLALVVDDYECLIVHREGSLKTFEDLKSFVRSKNSNSNWVGPASGGTDHLFAQKVWASLGMKANWIPYRSGGEAIAAILGKHGDVYVGNPQDTLGRPDLQVLAVASPQRLKGFESAPTFAELGYPELSGESLWRGFALRSETPANVRARWKVLLEKATSDPTWQQFVLAGAALPRFETDDEFRSIVHAQIESDKKLLF
ncbi:MAG: tripartite tricarboxylate transporter substrate binding protein [Bdellovibrionales bacterium]|nr:tripartite tricarboxylate transporter substrate binding protein [Bdellovibrionales bacterium]